MKSNEKKYVKLRSAFKRQFYRIHNISSNLQNNRSLKNDFDNIFMSTLLSI